ncbi:MAG: hypothetical protein U5R31_08460 [Acidimicrobiia bacterium]|nr:hypothetical protein [Acidimicrobiia bacterium]
MALQVNTIHDTADVVALRVAGTAEERPLLRLIDAVESAAEGKRRVVLDLDQLVIISASPIRTFIAQLLARVGEERVVLSCRRHSGRQVLRRWGGRDVQIVAELDAYPCNARQQLPTTPQTLFRTTRRTEPSPARGATLTLRPPG